MNKSDPMMICRVIGAIGLAGLLAACGTALSESVQEPSDQAAIEQGEEGARATSILNAGVMTQHALLDEEPVKFLFDPLYDDHFGSLEQLTPDLIEAIIAGDAPYDGVDAVFVSHAHGDHFSVSQLTGMLTAQPDVMLVLPAQGLERLREGPDWQEGFEVRVRAITLENGEASDEFTIEGATIDAFRSPHAGWPERHANVHNITFRVSVPGASGKVSRVMHLGDADPAPEHYEALETFLAAKRTGLAMVPFWFTGREDLEQIIDEGLNAQSMVAVHVPAKVPDSVKQSGWTYFSEAGEVLEIPPSE